MTTTAATKRMTAVFVISTGKYLVTFPDGSKLEFITLDDAALACDAHEWEMLYKGKVK